MEQSRTRSTTKNIVVSIFAQFTTAFLSFFTRTALINVLGIQAVSLNGLFSEVIAIISLAELGVGSAIVYNLYKPLAECDEKKICQLMTLFETAYRIIALVIFSIGLLLTPFIQYLVNSVDYSLNYIRIVYILFVIQSASSYLFAYKASLLMADQKKYIVSVITIVVKVVSVIGIVAVLYLTHNYIIYLCTVIVFNLVTNIASSLYVDNHYKYLRKDNSISSGERRNVFRNVKYLFIKTLSWRITTSTDNLLISTLVSTLQVGYYSNYSIFFNIIKQLQAQFSGSIAGSLGNLLATEKSERCVQVLGRLNYLFYVLSYVLCLGVLACISPVIKLWIGEEYLLPFSIVLISCFNIFIDFCKCPLWQVLEVSGLFKEDKNISIIGSTANLIISVILGLKYGMLGIFAGTTITYLVQLFLKIKLIYSRTFKISYKKYVIRWIYYLLSFIVGEIFVMLFCSVVHITNIFLQIVVNGIFAVVISLPFCIIVFLKSEDFRYMINLICSHTRSKVTRPR